MGYKKILITGLLVIITSLLLSGCFNENKSLTFNCKFDDSDDNLNITIWKINGCSSFMNAGKDFNNINFEIIDINSEIVWSGVANVTRENITYPNTTGVNYIDKKDNWDEYGDVSIDDLIIIKVPTDGKYKVKSTYNDKTCWISNLKHY